MMKRKMLWISAVALSFGVLVACLGELGATAANSVERAFAGQILLLKKRPPGYFKSQSGFIQFLRSNSISTISENEEQTWTFETMAFFKQPLEDYEVEMVFYDVEYGTGKDQRRFVTSYSQYTQDRNTRSVSGKTKLIRPEFDAYKRYMIVAQNRGKELAKSKTFETRGTSQAAIDQEKRYNATMKEMEKSMKDLEQRVKEQQENQKKKSEKAAEDLF
jgi:hypothetical protein